MNFSGTHKVLERYEHGTKHVRSPVVQFVIDCILDGSSVRGTGILEERKR